jgi:uncharacterized protein DUF1493
LCSGRVIEMPKSVMTADQNIEETVSGILQDIARPYQKIDASSRIYEDLSIAGDDAAELLDRVHAAFGTSFEGFDFSDYFPNEPDALFYHILRLFGWAPKKSLSVRHLVAVVEAGKWFEEKQPTK